MFERTRIILGDDGIEKLKNSSVMLLGLGGVGSYAFEALVRSGICNITIVDADTVAKSNLNRQLVALGSTIGMYKTDVAAARALDINPDCRVTCIKNFILPENIGELPFEGTDYIIDAIDTVSTKIALACIAEEKNIPIISVMGTGNKSDGNRFIITDIYKTSVCPLCRVMRYELKKRNVKKLKVVYSQAEIIKHKEKTVGSLPFVPPVAGLLAAGEVIKYLSQIV